MSIIKDCVFAVFRGDETENPSNLRGPLSGTDDGGTFRLAIQYGTEGIVSAKLQFAIAAYNTGPAGRVSRSELIEAGAVSGATGGIRIPGFLKLEFQHEDMGMEVFEVWQSSRDALLWGEMKDEIRIDDGRALQWSDRGLIYEEFKDAPDGLWTMRAWVDSKWVLSGKVETFQFRKRGTDILIPGRGLDQIWEIPAGRKLEATK